MGAGRAVAVGPPSDVSRSSEKARRAARTNLSSASWGRAAANKALVYQLCYPFLLFEQFEKGLALRDLVAEILRAGPRSISQVGKAFRERGIKLHRLAVAGYLKALADSGFLDEREIPPAKVYELKPSTSKRDLHASVAARARELTGGAPEASRLYLAALHELLRRPIFASEFKRVGLEVPNDAKESGTEERQAARRFLSRSPLELPFNDPAHLPNAEDATREDVRILLGGLLRDEFRASSLAMTTKQSKLGGAA